MTTQAAPAAASAPGTEPGAAARRRSLATLRRVRDLAGVVPFTVYVLLGLVLPMGAILIGTFKTPVTGHLTLRNIHIATHGIYLHGFAVSMELSLIASVAPGILGFLVAYAIYTARRGAVLRRAAPGGDHGVRRSRTSAACRWRSCSSPRLATPAWRRTG